MQPGWERLNLFILYCRYWYKPINRTNNMGKKKFEYFKNLRYESLTTSRVWLTIYLFLSFINPESSASHSIEFTAKLVLLRKNESNDLSSMKSASVMTTIALLLSSLLSKAATVLFGRLKSCLGVHVLFILKNTGTFWIPETDDDLASGVYV